MTEENMELNRQVQQFLAAIRAEGTKNCADIQTQTEAEVNTALEQTRQSAQAAAEESIRFETSRAAAQNNRRLSEGRAALRAELAEQREALQAEVFNAAREKLAAFAQSREYPAWLQKSADKMAAALGKKCTIYARSSDLKYIKVPAGAALAVDDEIQLGGLKGVGAQQAADDTLETRLAAEHDWFLENSGLTIVF